MKKQKFIQIQNEIPMTHFFVYKDKQYPFQIDFFKYSSKFFLNNQQSLEQNKIIPLVDKEYEESLNFSEESIFSFIKYVQREQIPLNDDNVFALNYLGTRYQINSLIESTKEYIEQNKTGLILQILTNFQFDQKFNKQQYEDILSTNLINYISDDRLLSLEYPIIYRAIEKTPNKSNSKIIDFCFKCLDKFGRKASSLFALIDICDVSNEKLNLLITSACIF